MIDAAETPAAASGSNASTALRSSAGAFSPDGAWWWDGAHWVPTVTPDGRWRWDGQAWQLDRGLDLDHPQAACVDLRGSAQDLYAQAGAIASQRRADWAVPHELQPVIEAIDAATAEMNRRRGRDREQASAQVHAIAADLGRRITAGAPPEVIGLIDLARRQAAIADSLAAAQGELERAQSAHQAAVDQARAGLSAAERARAEAISAARGALDQAERSAAEALAGHRARVKALRAPGPGAEIARFGAVVLFERVIDTPEGRGLAAGARAAVVRVEQLFDEHRDLIDGLAELGGYAGRLMSEADWMWPGHHFLLVETPTVTSLVPVAADEVEVARQFAGMVEATATAATAARAAARQALAAAEAELRSAGAGSEKAVAAARARLAKVEADPKLQGAVTAAQAALDRVLADTGSMTAARESLAHAGRLALEPPPPLQPA